MPFPSARVSSSSTPTPSPSRTAVRYVFSGHVHAGIQPSVKTAWLHRGICFIIAPSPVRPRPFGEEYAEFTLDGGYYRIVTVQGTDAQLFGRQIGRDAQHRYPATFRSFDPSADPRATKAAWNLPAHTQVENGGLERALEGWSAPHRYIADHDPGYVWRSETDRGASGQRAAYLAVREKGQGWALGEFTELYQVVRNPSGGAATLAMKYRPEDAVNGGGYVWAAGFRKQEACCLLRF